MPSKSPAQRRLMAAVAHGWKKPDGGGPSRKVAKEFNRADSRKHRAKERKSKLDKWARGNAKSNVSEYTT